MNIKFSLILFIQLCVIINGTKLTYYPAKPNLSGDLELAPQRCKRNEVFAKCGAPCPETCEFLHIPCSGHCKSEGACICREGYVRNDRQKCVRASRHCKRAYNCGRNEVFSSCAPLCEQECNIKIKCREGCEPKCICQSGYIRNRDYKCIKESKCPLLIPIHGEPEGPYPDISHEVHHSHEVHQSHEEHQSHEVHHSQEVHQSHEEHQSHEVHHSHGVHHSNEIHGSNEYHESHEIHESHERPEPCVLCNSTESEESHEIYESNEVNECEETCYGAHEVYSKCGTHPECTPTCDNPEVNNKHCDDICVEGCFCEDGYVLDQYGDCILVEECPEIQTNLCSEYPNEEYLSCGLHPSCVPTCDDPKLDVACPAICVEGCYCKDGYVRNSSGICVRKRNCPSVNTTCIGENEEFSLCGPIPDCTPTCDDRKTDVACPLVCTRGCYCKDGYLKNSFGKCVAEEDCPVNTNTCCGANESYLTCGTPLGCTPTCDDRKIDVQCITQCTEGCYCNDGYLRNSAGVCVREEACPINPCSGDNEIYQSCGKPAACTPTCDNRRPNIRCSTVCNKGCYCEPGYIRDDSGNCILEQDCPQKNNTCLGEHKVFTNCARPAGCLPTCENPENDLVCSDICIAGCECEVGYLINANGDCINEEICIKSNLCGANQIYETCGQPKECLPTCEDPNKIINVCTDNCVQGCYCKPGYLMNVNGDCIKSESCPINSSTCVDPLKVYKSCGKPSGCTPTCEKPLNEKLCPEICVPGCFCKEGYLMNEIGKCIKSSRCPPKNDPSTCFGPLKVFSKCGLNNICLPTCENPHNTRPCPNSCNAGCFCEEGYLINKKGDCVREDQCPPQKLCQGDHTYYDSCGKPPGFFPTCENPLNLEVCPDGCVEGCYCEDGYLMNKRGDCIRAEKCFENIGID